MPRNAKPTSSLESSILADVRDRLGSRRDIMALRINTGVYRPGDSKAGDNVRIRSAPNGTHDVLGCQIRRVKITVQKNVGTFNEFTTEEWFYYGQFFSVETKSLKGPARENQIKFATALNARAGISIFARSYEDVLAVLGPVPDWLDEIPEDFLLPHEK